MATVLMGCKLPHGLVAELNGNAVVLAGANSSELIGGFGLTDVDKDFAEAWLASEKDTPLVSKGLVFIANSRREAQSVAVEQGAQKTGLEALDAENPLPGVKQVKE